jgi:hypothetical protein
MKIDVRQEGRTSSVAQATVSSVRMSGQFRTTTAFSGQFRTTTAFSGQFRTTTAFSGQFRTISASW